MYAAYPARARPASPCRSPGRLNAMPVVVPESLESAIAALTAHPSSTVLAGGTDLMVEVNDGRRVLERVVAVGRVPELVRSLLDDPARLAAMGDEMRRRARPDAADAIAKELVALAS